MRLIDADEMILDLQNKYSNETFYKQVKENLIDCAPTVIATPIKHEIIVQTIKNGRYNRVFSCCNTDFTQLTMWLLPKYCPNCGAKLVNKKVL